MEDQITVNGRVFSIRRLLGTLLRTSTVNTSSSRSTTNRVSIISLETSLPQSSMTMRVFWPLESPCRACWMLT